jgi:hypothetical protein
MLMHVLMHVLMPSRWDISPDCAFRMHVSPVSLRRKEEKPIPFPVSSSCLHVFTLPAEEEEEAKGFNEPRARTKTHRGTVLDERFTTVVCIGGDRSCLYLTRWSSNNAKGDQIWSQEGEIHTLLCTFCYRVEGTKIFVKWSNAQMVRCEDATGIFNKLRATTKNHRGSVFGRTIRSLVVRWIRQKHIEEVLCAVILITVNRVKVCNIA